MYAQLHQFLLKVLTSLQHQPCAPHLLQVQDFRPQSLNPASDRPQGLTPTP